MGSAVDFIAVPVASLRVNSIIGFDLYLRPRSGGVPVLYRERNLRFEEEVRERLSANLVENLYISPLQADEYRRYVEVNLPHILADEEIPIRERSTILYSSAENIMKEAMTDSRSGEIFARSQGFVKNAMAFIFNHTDAIASLMTVTSSDYYTYTHSVNVFLFSVALARDLHYAQHEVLHLGVGALLHDIGKSLISPSILNCPGKLSPIQWREMKMHPVYGHDILSKRGITDALLLDIVLHHHEKRTGSGYPDGLTDRQISAQARICAIADIFDALTTRRPYKGPISTVDALSLMQREMQAELDPWFLTCFTKMIGNRQAKAV